MKQATILIFATVFTNSREPSFCGHLIVVESRHQRAYFVPQNPLVSDSFLVDNCPKPRGREFNINSFAPGRELEQIQHVTPNIGRELDFIPFVGLRICV